MVKLELIVDSDCPNADGARSVVREALLQLQLDPVWQEWNRDDHDCPDYAKHWGSPTILIDGVELLQLEAEATKSCRIYQDDNGALTGIPPLALLLRTLAGR